MKRVLCAAICLSLIGSGAVAAPGSVKPSSVAPEALHSAGTKADWTNDRSQGGRLELKNNFAGAIALYERGLKKLPANALSEKVDLQCLIAMNYLRLHQDDKAEAAVDAMLVSFKKLQATKALSADTEMSLHSFIEEIDGDPGTGLSVAQLHKRNLLAFRVVADVLPDLINYSRVAKVSRGYLGRGKPALALDYVNLYLARMPKSALKYSDLLLNAAALKCFLGDASKLDAIAKEMRKTKSASIVASRVAEAQTWATDYRGADKTIDKCLKELKDKKTLTQSDEVHLNLARLGNYLDHGLWAQAEKLARQTLTYKMDEETRRVYLEDLAFCLKYQGKTKEAARIEAQSNQYSFLEDDERAAEAEIARKHAKKH